METSDSEYFESADEEFDLDQENALKVKKSQTHATKINKKEEADLELNKLLKLSVSAELPESKLEDWEGIKNKNTSKSCAETNQDTISKNKDDRNLAPQEVDNIVKVEDSLEKGKADEDILRNGAVSCVVPDQTEHKNVENQNVLRPETDNIVEPKDNLRIEQPAPINIRQELHLPVSSKIKANLPVANDSKEDFPCISKNLQVQDENLWDDEEIDWGRNDADKDENMWDNDLWEPIEENEKENSEKTESPLNLPRTKPKIPEPPTELPRTLETTTPTTSTSWGGWSNWGVSSILSTATQGVSSLTHGISTVLESGIGVPQPEELARIDNLERKNRDDYEEETSRTPETQLSGFNLGNLVSGVSHLTKLVETTGTKVISGGLDTLETIGKKTMEVLQDGDPGLRKKRAFLKIDQDRPVLSALLREAKEKAENENKMLEEKHYAKKAKNYEMLFDDHQGLVHLEALEMLSKQCDLKVQSLLESCSGDELTGMRETLDQVKELCELPDEDEDEQANFDELKVTVDNAASELNIPITYKRLFETWEETDLWLKNLKLEVCDERELHQQAIETLAQLTAIAVEQFHKTAELLLVKERRTTVDEADSLVQLTSSLVALIGIVAARFSDKLNAKGASSSQNNETTVNSLITNVFYEAANSSSYIQDAFQLLLPILQVGAI